MKNEIIDLLKSTQREGIDRLIKFLENSDYFEAPASKDNYYCYPGGLIKYCMRVYKLLKLKNEFLKYNISEQSLIICAFLHCICKVNLYERFEEEPSKAQLNYLKTLCNQYDFQIPEGTNITKKIADVLINSIKCGQIPNNFNNICNYRVKDVLPLGYGEKSLYLISQCIELNDAEALAIRYYLGYSDLIVHYTARANYQNALKFNPLVSLLYTSSLEAITFSNFK